ncbi:MAG TPA: GTP-binding protein, partial [Chromatiaceae bacterium]|nr:GTP-binding protein [Chromatiaceae bacterium]
EQTQASAPDKAQATAKAQAPAAAHASAPVPAPAKPKPPRASSSKVRPRNALVLMPSKPAADPAGAEGPNAPRPRRRTRARTRGDAHLDLARESLRDLVQDPRVPPEVRAALAEDYAEVEAMLEKLDQGHIHVAAFGRVSVGKSATLNALLGGRHFSTSPLHGETKTSQMGRWAEFDAGGIFLIDTPGLNEVEGEERERLAHQVAARSDLVLFVVDGDLTDTEIRALRILLERQRPTLIVFNKVDRYTSAERSQIREAIARHTAGFIDPRNIVGISALPAERLVISVDAQGHETESLRQDPPDLKELKTRLWELLETEGKTLAALNASLFASDLSDQVAQRILQVKRKLGQRLIRSYCIGKGVAVALNPVPVADLLAALAVDVAMVVHLARLYGLPLSRREAGSLVKVIATQLTLLMGTVWAVNLISSALKLGTGGLSTVLTGTAQGAVAYYSTYVVGQAAETYLAQGKSWGELGPKHVIRSILDGIDRESVLAQARSDIAARLRKS